MFGFIILRHVNSVKTNLYWNHAVQCIQRFYPFIKIVIIDDNSNHEFLNTDCYMEEIIVINSEFIGRGEILPYYYLMKYKWFDNAVIVHDSVFFQQRIHFEHFCGQNVVPLWSFEENNENLVNVRRIASQLQNNTGLLNVLGIIQLMTKWSGCFGSMAFINTDYLLQLEAKYKLSNLIHFIKCREDRCSLERLLGIIFSFSTKKSVFGDIFRYGNWDLSYDEYMNNSIKSPVIKVFTGR
jgi:hypothetical protein